MARVLAISSQVVRGRIGLNAVRPALEGLGHEVLALPTTVLSNHPGHRHWEAALVDVSSLGRMADALDRNGWLDDLDGFLTGYLPTIEHARFAEELLTRLHARCPRLVYLCDPILGDDPGGLYVQEPVAEALRDRLVPRADIATPNRFELAWLARRPVASIEAAISAARGLNVEEVLATSVPAPGDTLTTVIVTDDAAVATTTPRRASAPHGTGDLLAGLYFGHRLAGLDPAKALAQSAASLAQVLAQSPATGDLVLAAGTNWQPAAALPTRTVCQPED